VSQKWCRLAGRNRSATTRFRLPPAAPASARVKRVLKIADQIQPELERDQRFARMVAWVRKLDVDAVPLGFGLRAISVRTPTPICPGRRARDVMCGRSDCSRPYRTNASKWTAPRNFAAVLIDVPKPKRLPEIRSPLDEKRIEDAEPATGVLDALRIPTTRLIRRTIISGTYQV
jgi:hypothetical protein